MIYIYIIPEVCIVLYYIVLYYIILYHISNIICWILYHFTILFGGFGPAIPTGHPFGDVEVHQFGVGAKKNSIALENGPFIEDFMMITTPKW